MSDESRVATSGIQIGEMFIHRRIKAPPGTSAQRIAWAAATPGGNLLTVLDVQRDVIYAGVAGTRAPLRFRSVADIENTWERP